jgi:hypothetical protein
MNYQAINFAQKFALFKEQWQPKVVAEMNDYQFKLVNMINCLSDRGDVSDGQRDLAPA